VALLQLDGFSDKNSNIKGANMFMLSFGGDGGRAPSPRSTETQIFHCATTYTIPFT
jgi:hypothetical protein